MKTNEMLKRSKHVSLIRVLMRNLTKSKDKGLLRYKKVKFFVYAVKK